MTIVKGRTSLFRCTLLLDGVATPPDIASDLHFIVKWNAADDDGLTVLTCNVGDGIVITGGAGEFTLKISASKTSSLPLSNGRLTPMICELYYTVSGEVYSLKVEPFYVEPSVKHTI